MVRSDKFSIDVNVKVPEKKPEITSPAFELSFKETKFQTLYDRLRDKIDPKGVEIERLEVVFRSPERMVRFLGDIIATQELAKDGKNLKIRIGENVVDLFRAERGGNSKAAVAVKGPEGERFVIPIPDHSAANKHRSLSTLALVTDFINSAVSGKAIPAPNTFVLSGS